MSFWHPHQSSRQTPLTSRHRHFLATACGLGLLFPGHGILASGVQAGGKIPASSSTKLTPENATPASATGSTPAAKPAPKAGDAGQPAAVDVQVRSKEILEHLNAVIQFFRLSTRPAVQTVGEPSDALYREQAVNQTTQVANLAFQYARAEAALLATADAEGRQHRSHGKRGRAGEAGGNTRPRRSAAGRPAGTGQGNRRGHREGARKGSSNAAAAEGSARGRHRSEQGDGRCAQEDRGDLGLAGRSGPGGRHRTPAEVGPRSWRTPRPGRSARRWRVSTRSDRRV